MIYYKVPGGHSGRRGLPLFTKIAASDKEDISHLDRMKEIFDEGVVDVFEDDVLSSLVTNQKLWDDLML